MKYEDEINKKLIQQETEELQIPINKNTVPFVIKLACVLVSIIAIIYIGIVGEAVLVPLIIGFFVALLLVPLSNFFEKKFKFSRIISSFASPILFSIFVLSVAFFIGNQVGKFTTDLPVFEQKVQVLFDEGTDYISKEFGITKHDQVQYINKQLVSTLQKNSQALGSVIISLTSGIASAAFVFLYIFFFLLYRSHFVKFLVWCFRPEFKEQVKDSVFAVQSIIKQYIFGLMIQMMFIATALSIIFTIIGIKYGILFAVICAVMNLIPYVGIFTATAFAAMVTFVTGEPIDALWLFVSVVAVNSIDNNVVTPKVIGSKVSLNAFVVFFGIIVAEKIWGIPGMFIAIPTLAILRVIFDAVLDLRPYGFLLGSDDQTTPLFDKFYMNDSNLKVETESKSETTTSENLNTPEENK